MREYDLISSYRKIDDNYYDPNLHSDKWLNCPRCLSKPLLNIFDNGRTCACKCATMYGKEYKINATPIMKHYNDHNTLKGYNELELRDNWNRHCKSLIRESEINKLI